MHRHHCPEGTEESNAPPTPEPRPHRSATEPYLDSKHVQHRERNRATPNRTDSPYWSYETYRTYETYPPPRPPGGPGMSG